MCKHGLLAVFSSTAKEESRTGVGPRWAGKAAFVVGFFLCYSGRYIYGVFVEVDVLPGTIPENR